MVWQFGDVGVEAPIEALEVDPNRKMTDLPGRELEGFTCVHL